MACQWQMFYIHSHFGVLFTAGKCSSMWRFIPKGMCYYRGVWHGVPMGDVWSTYTPMTLLQVPGADQNLNPETYTPSIMCQLHGEVCMEWTFVLSGTGECGTVCLWEMLVNIHSPKFKLCTWVGVWCAPPRCRGSGVPSTGRVWCVLYGEGLVCPPPRALNGDGFPWGASGVPSPQRVWCALHGEGLVCPPPPTPQHLLSLLLLLFLEWPL